MSSRNTEVYRPCVKIEENDVLTKEQLGTGGFSVVYRGTWLGTPVAVKKWLNGQGSEAERNEMRGEIMTNAVSRLSQQALSCAVLPLFHEGSAYRD